MDAEEFEVPNMHGLPCRKDRPREGSEGPPQLFAHEGDAVRVEFDAEVIEVPETADYFDTVTVRESRSGLTAVLPASRMRLVHRVDEPT